MWSVFRSINARPESESRLMGRTSTWLTGSADGPFEARWRSVLPSVRYIEAADASHRRAARSAIASRTGNTSVGELEITRKISATAVCCSRPSLVSLNSRTFSIAIENVRLFNETREGLEQQTAVAEILRVISSSPTDVLPVLDAIAERAARLCDASAASMYLTEGNTLRHLASKGPSAEPVNHVDVLPIDRDSLSGRALIERKTLHIRDMQAEVHEYPLSAH